MWNKRKEDENMPRPSAAPATPAPVEANRESVAAAPGQTAHHAASESPRGVAAIGKSVLIKGQILSREDLYLDGEMEGTVEVPDHRLTIGQHAKLQASIRAREVVVLGTVNGNVEATEKIDIRKDAKLVGDIKTGGIIIEDGAYFKGSIDIVRTAEAGRTAAQVVRQPTAQPMAQPAGQPAVQPVVSTATAMASEIKR
ncbi:MAG: polymer-forming cytoskeletal protein [Bryobacteraceae bacterium]